MTALTSVSVIGLGAMGYVIAETFVKAGFSTTVWNRSIEKASPLAAKGAHVAKTVVKAVEANKLIIICVLDNNVVDDILTLAGSSLRDRIVINYTHGIPGDAIASSKIVAANGGQYLDSAILHTPQSVGKDAILIYSGPKELYDYAYELVKVLGVNKYLDSDFTTASLFDNALLSSYYGLFSGLIHSASLIHASKKSSLTDYAALLVPVLNAITGYFHLIAQQIDSGDYSTTGSSLGMQLPAIEHIVDLSKELGVTTDFILPIKGYMERAIKGGRGNEDLAALIEYTISKTKQN